jgi:hypothetical protein
LATELIARVSNPTPGDSILYVACLNNEGFLHLHFVNCVEANHAMSRLETFLVARAQENEDGLSQAPYLQVSDVVCSVLLCQGRTLIDVAPAA